MYAVSDRVSAHTSLSLIYSFTFRLGDKSGDGASLDPLKPLPQPLPVSVLLISLPSPGTEVPKGHNVKNVSELFDPRTFILQSHRHGLPRRFQETAYDSPWTSGAISEVGISWTLLSLVVQSGTSVYASVLDRLFRDSKAARPLRVIYDHLDVQADPDKHFRILNVGIATDASISYGKRALVKKDLRIWFATETVKTDYLASEPFLPIDTDLCAATVFEVPSARVRALRDEIIHHGVRKNLDWAALDEL